MYLRSNFVALSRRGGALSELLRVALLEVGLILHLVETIVEVHFCRGIAVLGWSALMRG